MKLSLNWLKEFVDLDDITPQEIMSKLSLVTAEVEGLEEKGKNIQGVVVGEILTCKPHPTSKKPLWVLTVDQGDKVVPVVCGSSNVRAGMKVPFAQVGAKLPMIEVREANLAGEASHGMCLGADEIGIAAIQTEVIELDKNLINGTGIEVVFPDIVDTIFDIDNKSLTHRPDLWGHYGFARELAVIFDKKLKPLGMVDLDKYRDLPEVPVTIENPDDCYSFGAFKVENITQKATPIPMQIRLFYCGINSHGFLVDLSNYILLELGQPNHAFDARRVGKLSAGNVLDKDAKFTTLKGQTFDIKPEYLFIKSDGVPVSLAGIMGGDNSLIQDDTQSVVFEFATFNPTTIRKTSTTLGIRSDSSTRYEKSLDTNLNKTGAARAIKLLLSHDKRAKVVSNFNWKVAKPTKGVGLSLPLYEVEKFAGINFDWKEVKKNLAGLGFEPDKVLDYIAVIVPTWRATKDVTGPEDVIEEITRTYGYNNIPPIPPKMTIRPVEKRSFLKLQDKIKDVLASKHALTEVHSYIWNDAKTLKDLKIESPSYLKIVNSVSQGMEEIRSNLIPTLIATVAKNKGRDNTRIFEVASVYKPYPNSEELRELTHLGIAIASKEKKADELYRELAHLLDDVFGSSGYKLRYELGKVKESFLHPKNNAKITLENKPVGQIGIIHPTVTGVIDTRLGMVACYVCLDDINSVAPQIKTPKATRFPKTVLDFTITTNKTYSELERVFDSFEHDLVFSYKLKVVFPRDNGLTSYTLQFKVGSALKTLTQEEIQGVWQKVVDHGKKNGFIIDNT